MSNQRIKNIPSIKDPDYDGLHKLSCWNRLFWYYGFINDLSLPIARKNKITGIIMIRYYNETFSYWCWVMVSDKYKNMFEIYEKTKL